MFPGQGAQYYQMGQELFQKEVVFREFLEQGDLLARKFINQSLIDIIYRERSNRFEPFSRLIYTHPALLLFECAMAELLKNRGLHPDYLLGYSLGVYACLVVSGMAPFAEVLEAIIKQAELTEYCAPAGGMLAILESVEIMGQYPSQFRGCTIAARNFERNFVVSGAKPMLGRLQAFLKAEGISTAELPVDYAFHSSDMDVVQSPGVLILEQLTLTKPRIPIISVNQPGLLENISVEHLQAVTRQSMDFIGTIRWLESSGPRLYADLGPSGSMATATKYNLAKTSTSQFVILSSPFGHEADNVRALVEKCKSRVER
jgi:bacillaene synthase trans-acting acyltransferase